MFVLFPPLYGLKIFVVKITKTREQTDEVNRTDKNLLVLYELEPRSLMPTH